MTEPDPAPRHETPPDPPADDAPGHDPAGGDFIARYRARERDRREAREWQRLGAAGVEFAGAIILFGLIGWGIDYWLGTLPWGLVIGVVIGFAVGMYLLIRTGLGTFR